MQGNKNQIASVHREPEVRAALSEAKHWLRRAYRRKLLTPRQINDVKTLFDELIPGYKAYLRSLGTARHDDSPSDNGHE